MLLLFLLGLDAAGSSGADCNKKNPGLGGWESLVFVPGFFFASAFCTIADTNEKFMLKDGRWRMSAARRRERGREEGGSGSDSAVAVG